MSRNSQNSQTIYSATYSNVPVFEFNIDGNHVMRRRSDDWINATHILKVADYDKPARTRILEREVQKGVHEKVQGGYGKYQGTWIPLPDGRDLAQKNGVLEKLLPIFTFVPGDRSPPPAPKHATAASSKPRVPRAAPAQKKAPAANMYHHVQDYEKLDTSMHDETPDHETVASESQFGDYQDMAHTGSRKRRRVEDQLSQADREHQLWAEDLLDYFVLQETTMDSQGPTAPAPIPPANANLDRPIDERGHTALHWAAAIGDIEVVKDLIRRGASIDVQSKNGETPLMRSVIFTNCFDKRNMDRLAGLLIRTVNMQEWSGSTVFHHVAGITSSKKKYECARYYMDCILNKMAEVLSPDQIERILNEADQNGDTAIMIAARHGARKCVRSLIGRNAAVDVPNAMGETADQLIVQLNHRRQERHRQLSSSPFQADSHHHLSSTTAHLPNGSSIGLPLNLPFDPLPPHSSGTHHSGFIDTYKSEPALTLASSVVPDLVAKTRTLATALDAEIAEKDAEVLEAERVIGLRRSELDRMKAETEALRVKEMEQTSGGADNDAELIAMLDELERECEGLTEEEQAMALAELVREEEGKVNSAHTHNEGKGGVHEEMMRQKMDTARELLRLQRERRELVKTIVRSLAVAGGVGGERQGMYKRLITGALGVREEDVEGLLPEILGELEGGGWGA